MPGHDGTEGVSECAHFEVLGMHVKQDVGSIRTSPALGHRISRTLSVNGEGGTEVLAYILRVYNMLILIIY